MAMAKVDQNYGWIEGRLGGVVYWTDQCGYHLTVLPHRINRYGSGKYPKQTQAFQKTVNFFRKTFPTIKDYTIPETRKRVEAWADYAKTHPIINEHGKKEYLSFYQMFLSVNIKQELLGLPMMTYPPDWYIE